MSSLQSSQLTAQINIFSCKRIDLYRSPSLFENKLVEKAGLEKDLSSGGKDLAEANRTLDQFCHLLEPRHLLRQQKLSHPKKPSKVVAIPEDPTLVIADILEQQQTSEPIHCSSEVPTSESLFFNKSIRWLSCDHHFEQLHHYLNRKYSVQSFLNYFLISNVVSFIHPSFNMYGEQIKSMEVIK